MTFYCLVLIIISNEARVQLLIVLYKSKVLYRIGRADKIVVDSAHVCVTNHIHEIINLWKFGLKPPVKNS